MKKIKIEGEFGIEIRKQIDTSNAIKSEIEDLSRRCFEIEKRMWKHLKKEIPEQSDNCILSVENDELIFIDRLAD